MPQLAVEIPAAPVLVPLTLLAAVVLIVVLHRRGALTPARILVAGTACCYGAGVLRAVLFPFAVLTGVHGNDVPWWVYVQPVPLLTADPAGIVLNAALFVPLGFLLPLLAPATSTRRAAVVAFLVSLAIETTQLVGDVTVSTGRVFDVDDLLANTLGGVLGCAVFRAAVSVPAVARLAAAARWPGRPAPVASVAVSG